MKRAELIDWFLYWRAGKAEKRKVNEMNKSMNSFWRMNDLWMEWGKCRSAAIIAVNESKRKSMKREEIKQFVGWFVWLKLIDFWWTERSEQQPTIHNWNEEKAGFWFMKLWVMAGAQPSAQRHCVWFHSSISLQPLCSSYLIKKERRTPVKLFFLNNSSINCLFK